MSKYNFPPGIADLRDTGEYSDLEIRCGGETFSVHRAFVCKQSKVFEKLCNSEFKEAKEGVVELHDDDPGIVSLMLDYFYRFDYDEFENARDDQQNCTSEALASSANKKDPAPVLRRPEDTLKRSWSTLVSASFRPVPRTAPVTQNESNKSKSAATATTNSYSILESQLTNVAVYALAEKYFVPALKDLAVTKFKSHPISTWMDDHGVASVIRAVYTTTPQSDRGLRNPLVEACANSYNEINDEEYKKTLMELPDARMDILELTISHKEVALFTLQQSFEASQKALREENLRMSAQIEEMKTAWDRTCQIYNSHMYCRHNGCRAEFMLSIDSADSNLETGKVIVRCRMCRTKHAPP